jgi:hypothetical protein
MPLATFGGVWLGAELVGESGPGTCSLEEEKSPDEDGKASGLLPTGGCGDGEDLGVSFGDPEKVVMNDRTDREALKLGKSIVAWFRG